MLAISGHKIDFAIEVDEKQGGNSHSLMMNHRLYVLFARRPACAARARDDHLEGHLHSRRLKPPLS
jgi:hypothetical protein